MPVDPVLPPEARPGPSPREVSAAELSRSVPVYAVWELTTRCDQPCQHCGTRAGSARADELSTEKIREVAASLAGLGCREVTLIGGEAYLRADVYAVVAHLVAAGLRVSMQSGGRALTPERIGRFKAAGISSIGISIDGLEAAHDTLRGNHGSHAAALRALTAIRAAGLPCTANTQINRLTKDQLWELSALLRDHGAVGWQVQLTVPMGNAADHPEWLLDPPDIVAVIDTLAAIQIDAVQHPRPHERPVPRRAFNIQTGNNVGYYGPHEQVLRSRPGGRERFWSGCAAGRGVIGIESDGSVKACPSLPSAPYVGGNVRDLTLEQIWQDTPELNFTRKRTADELWGFCKTCYYNDICMAGCSFTTHTLLGRRGNNPWCYHRVMQLRKAGRKERLVQVEKAAGERYDFGRFEIVEEDITD